MNVFNNVILARNRQLPDNDDRMIETCRSNFKSFNINNLSVCIGLCADQMTLRSVRCNGTDCIQCWPSIMSVIVLPTPRGGFWGWQVGRPPQAPLLRGPHASGLWVCQAISSSKLEILIHAPFKKKSFFKVKFRSVVLGCLLYRNRHNQCLR